MEAPWKAWGALGNYRKLWTTLLLLNGRARASAQARCPGPASSLLRMHAFVLQCCSAPCWLLLFLSSPALAPLALSPCSSRNSRSSRSTRSSRSNSQKHYKISGIINILPQISWRLLFALGGFGGSRKLLGGSRKRLGRHGEPLESLENFGRHS